jgi:hypothetical protein
MGLTLTAVSKDYHYDENGEGAGEQYFSTDIGYIGYKIFRDDGNRYLMKLYIGS